MNPILQKTEAGIRAKVDKRLLPAVDKIVSAGQELMYNEKTSHMAVKALTQTDPHQIGESFAGVAIILLGESKGKLPMDALVPAGVLLMVEGLDQLDASGRQKVDANFLATAQQAYGAKLLELLKVTPESLQQMVNKSQGGKPGAPRQAPPGIVAGAQKGGV